jgi:hypothetical protein
MVVVPNSTDIDPVVPSFAVFAFANEERVVRLVVTRSTNASAFLQEVSITALRATDSASSHFSSRYNSPKLTKAVSYSRTAASEVTAGGLEMISLYCASAFLGSVFAVFFASSILDESATAILLLLNLFWKVERDVFDVVILF